MKCWKRRAVRELFFIFLGTLHENPRIRNRDKWSGQGRYRVTDQGKGDRLGEEGQAWIQI
jgi:hypothetical protein